MVFLILVSFSIIIGTLEGLFWVFWYSTIPLPHLTEPDWSEGLATGGQNL